MLSINEYLNALKINGQTEHTLINVEQTLRQAADFKPLSKWTQGDTTKYLLKLQGKYKPSSIEYKKAVLKRYFSRGGKDKVVEHLKIKSIKGDLNRDELLTVDDVNKLIETTASPMYKALFAFLFESGARISEALNVKVDDIQETEDKGMIIKVTQTKTGLDRRRGLYVYSAGYIRNHISYSGLKKGDRLFGVTRPAVHLMLQKIGKDAGIDKPLSPHKFRHSSATHMVLSGYQEAIIRKKMGWTDDSRMISRYQHIIDDDVINAESEKKTNGQVKKPVISSIKMAEPLKIADASMQLSKLSEENEFLKLQVKELQNQMTALDIQTPKVEKDYAGAMLELIDMMKSNPHILGLLEVLKRGEINQDVVSGKLRHAAIDAVTV